MNLNKIYTKMIGLKRCNLNKEEYVKLVNEKIRGNARKLLLEQIDRFYNAVDNYRIENNHYKVGDLVHLKKGTLLHGTYKNIEGLDKIAREGLICDLVVDGRSSKYPLTVGVWNLQKDYLLKDYIDFYSGATIMFKGENLKETSVISYSKMPDIINIVTRNDYHLWTMEQTKEARFMPSYQQENVQIGIIFNGNNCYAQELLKGDILNTDISDKDVKPFINEWYYERFLKDIKEKDDFFTDRESAIIFGLPACFIEGILVGRKYESEDVMLKRIKALLPNCYICNLDGKVIVE